MGSTLPTLCPNRDKNWKWHFPFRSGPHQPTLPNGKNEKMKNDLRVLKQILYNMGCQMDLPEGLEVQASSLTTILAEEAPTKKKIIILF